nr:MAG TPA: hypothetical protein [Caudoviricetes sp.]
MAKSGQNFHPKYKISIIFNPLFEKSPLKSGQKPIFQNLKVGAIFTHFQVLYEHIFNLG